MFFVSVFCLFIFLTIRRGIHFIRGGLWVKSGNADTHLFCLQHHTPLSTHPFIQTIRDETTNYQISSALTNRNTTPKTTSLERYNLLHLSFTFVLEWKNCFLKVLKSNLDRRDHVMEKLKEDPLKYLSHLPCSFPCYSPGFASHWGGVVGNSCLELLSFSHISDRNSLHISDRNSPQISDRNSARFSRKVCFLWCHTRCDSKQNPKL